MKAALERTLEYWPLGATQPTPICVRIGAPEPHPEYDWECLLTIEGFPGMPVYSKGMHGSDAMDAISYALATAPLHLRLMGQRGSRLTWNGQEELRFPSMFSEPTQDFRHTPRDGGEPRKLSIRIGLPEWIDERWSVLVSCTDCKTWSAVEKRVHADAWAKALELAVVAVPELLQEQVGLADGGAFEEMR